MNKGGLKSSLKNIDDGLESLNSNGNKSGDRSEKIVKLIFKGVIPIVLIVCGVALLFAKIPGWGVLLGLPMVVMGTIFMIYAYDEMIQKEIEPIEGEFMNCNICGKPTPKLPGVEPEDAICPSCSKDWK